MADQLGRIFVELNDEHPEPLGTRARMRFSIKLTRTDGTDVSVFIMPSMKKWFDERSVYALDPAAAELIRQDTRGAKEDPSLVLHTSPFVRLEVIDLEDGYGNRRAIPLKAVVTGRVLELTAAAFPEIGWERPKTGPNGGIPRFRLIFTRENGETVHMFVNAPGLKDWTWYTDEQPEMTWEVSDFAAQSIIGFLQKGKEDPSVRSRF